MTAAAAVTPDGHFTTSADLGLIRYSQVWEDHLLLERGLRLGPGHDVLSIASAGDNVLAMLLAEPRSILAVDVSPAQTALVELKLAALRRLTHADFAGLVGARPCADRARLYARVRDDLGRPAQAFWDAHPAALRAGPIRAGLTDSYYEQFRRRHIARLIEPAVISRLLVLDDREEQARLFERHFATPAYESAVRADFTPASMAGRGRDATQFRYAELDDLPGFLLQRMRHVCTQLATRGNFYLEWALTGRYRDLAAGPSYLRPANFDRLRELADRVTVTTADLVSVLRSHPAGAFSAANLSDVFDYLPQDASGELLELVASRLRPGGRIAYWNQSARRSRPPRLADRLSPRRAEAHELWQQDRLHFYRDFHLEERI
jgi:S-adenosylmethionine-diacylglycerol 3-amino-3-carboxypropyl transferase